jgi:hypothetical protein
VSRKSVGAAARSLALCAVLLCTACLGPNHAQGRLAKWNSEFENKWARQGVFMVIFPGYLIFSLADNFIFNSLFWWTGDNPIDPPQDHSGPSDIGM